MGLMEQFAQRTTKTGRTLSDALAFAREVAGNDPRAVIDKLASNGAMVTLPNGRTMSVRDLATMADGMSPQELLSQLGIR